MLLLFEEIKINTAVYMRDKALLLSTWCSFFLLLSLSSCHTSKSVIYFNQIHDTTAVSPMPPPPINIRNGDLLAIQVNSMDPEHAGVFNQVGTSSVSAAPGMSGYLVDETGCISFMQLGKVKVAGMNKDQIKSMLEKKLDPYLKDPVVTIRLMNFKLNLIGEFTRPGIYSVDQENINIIQALALAGDITIYGKRREVLLIRQNDSLQVVRHIDLTDKEIMYSPYYYLQQGDILYVKPNQAKVLFSNVTWQLLPVASTATSLVLVIITFIRK
jgi:polysaccharide export outer membrane protein